MNQPYKNLGQLISVKQVLVLFALGMIVFHFIFTAFYSYPGLNFVFKNVATASLLLVAIICSLFGLSFFVAKQVKDHDAAWSQGLFALSPIALLLFWPAQDTHFNFLFPVGVAALASFLIILIMKNPSRGKKEKRIFGMSLMALIYFGIFVYLGVGRFNALELFNAKDWAVYDQMFWNASHGRFFESSFYGSNLACHNTWFFFLLIPFYSLFPHPLTLLVLKVGLLSASVIPFYWIAKNIFKEEPPRALVLCFLFYPYLVSQNLNAPHEMGFAPFFILCVYCFYRAARFLPFLCFLVIFLTIKEHLSAVAVGFGLYAWVEKRERRWIVVPIVFGVIWGLFSLWALDYFKQIYHSHSDPSWFITSFKRQYLSCQGSALSCGSASLIPLIKGMGAALPSAFLLLSPLLVVLPFLSSVAWLGLPEMMLNFFAQRSVMFSPLWHYNVVGSCFFLIASIEGIKRISDATWVKNWKLSAMQIRSILSVLMLASIFVHSYTWLDFAGLKKNTANIKVIREALAVVPSTAHLTVSVQMAPLVSQRKKLSLLSEGDWGEFVLMKSDESFEVSKKVNADYDKIFEKEQIALFQKRR